MVDKSRKFVALVRLGMAARGVVYLLIGYLALTAAREDPGPEGAFSWLQDVPLGTPMLYLAALGLVGYALFRLGSLVLDIENHGTDAKGISYRVAHGGSGFAHLGLAWAAVQFARGDAESSGGTEAAAATLIAFPLGSLLLGLLGVGFLAAAAAQAKSAISASFMERIAANAPAFVEPLGRAGHAARAVVFAVIGGSLVQSAWLATSSQVKTLGEAVSSLADQGLFYTLVAAGLALFGAFSLLLARYRIIPEMRRREMTFGSR